MELLSIGIATYNRKDKLYKLLKSLQNMNKGNFKIIIVDNASSDGTDIMIEEFLTDTNICYSRNDENVGLDGNYIEVIKKVKGISKYTLLLGDDDKPIEYFFYEIPKILEKYSPDIVINKLKNGICFASYFENKENYIEEDIHKSFKLLLEHGWVGTIISNDLLDITCAAKYFGSAHLPMGTIVEVLTKSYNLNNKVKTYVIPNPYINSAHDDYSHAIPDTLVISLTGYAQFIGWCPNLLQHTARFFLNVLILWHGWWDENCVAQVKKSYESALFIRHSRIVENTKEDFVWGVPWAKLNTQNNFFKNYFSKFNTSIFIIFGAGEYGEKCIRLFGKYKNLIKYFVDSDENKQKESLHGIPIYAPSKIAQESSDGVIIIAVISEKYLSEIQSQIKSMNLSVNKVETIYEFSLELLESLNFKRG